MQSSKIGIVSDHSGLELKRVLVEYLSALEHETIDLGPEASHDRSVDYPDFAEILCLSLNNQEIDLGIAICGTGIGMSIAANKFPNIRAAHICDEFSARMAKEHNNANILCLGARTLNQHRVVDFIKIWLTSEFLGERHQLRLDKISEIEKKNFTPSSHRRV